MVTSIPFGVFAVWLLDTFGLAPVVIIHAPRDQSTNPDYASAKIALKPGGGGGGGGGGAIIGIVLIKKKYIVLMKEDIVYCGGLI